MRTFAWIAAVLASTICLAADAPTLPLAVQHPAMKNAPRLSRTTLGIHGDPINLGLIGAKEELVAAMLAAKWLPADPITVQSSVKIAQSTLLHRPYETAPVSNLYVWGRKEDLAFEQVIGKDARRRHHVRFWQSKLVDDAGHPLWFGAATFDTKVGFSHTTGMVTHHIDANIDADRDRLIKDLTEAGAIVTAEQVEGFHTNHDGRNGGGDKYHTDGKLSLGLLKAREQQAETANPKMKR